MMKKTIHLTSEKEGLILLDVTVENFYKELAERLVEFQAPDKIDVDSDYGRASYNLVKRSGTKFIQELYNYIKIPNDACEYTPRYLVCINEEHNNYKFYKLEEKNNQLKVTYGRIGNAKGDMYGEKEYFYDLSMYWIKYLEKINKGYVDKSEIYLAENLVNKKNVSKNDVTEYSTEASRILYEALKGHAKLIVERSCVSTHITENMVKESKNLFALLPESKSVDEFNDTLKKLMMVSPRRVTSVNALLALDEKDFPKIIDREESLIQAMEALISKKPVKSAAAKKAQVGFDAEGVEVYFATDKQKEQVLNALSDSLKPKVKNIFRVINKAQQKRFNKYIKDNNITSIKQLWHGSKNENWYSIIVNNLQLNPNAVITGKMFGKGICVKCSTITC